MWNGHKVLVQGSRLVNLMYSYYVLLSYVPWFKCVWTRGLCEYVSNMQHSGICWRGWLICEWYLLTWISMWHVHDWEPYDMCLAKCHMLYCVNNAWMSCVWTSWNVWSGYWRDDIFMIGWVRYRNVHIELHSVYSWHTHMCYETMHSFPRINSYHSCKWDCNDFIIYLLLNKSWKGNDLHI